MSRAVFWLLLAAIAFVTLSSISDRPVTGFPPNLERFAAFLLIGVTAGIAYPKKRLWLAFWLVVAAGGLELAQHLSPTRHGRESDFFVKAIGGILGVALAPLLEQIAHALRRRSFLRAADDQPIPSSRGRSGQMAVAESKPLEMKAGSGRE